MAHFSIIIVAFTRLTFSLSNTGERAASRKSDQRWLSMLQVSEEGTGQLLFDGFNSYFPKGIFNYLSLGLVRLKERGYLP